MNLHPPPSLLLSLAHIHKEEQWQGEQHHPDNEREGIEKLAGELGDESDEEGAGEGGGFVRRGRRGRKRLIRGPGVGKTGREGTGGREGEGAGGRESKGRAGQGRGKAGREGWKAEENARRKERWKEGWNGRKRKPESALGASEHGLTYRGDHLGIDCTGIIKETAIRLSPSARVLNPSMSGQSSRVRPPRSCAFLRGITPPRSTMIQPHCIAGIKLPMRTDKRTAPRLEQPDHRWRGGKMRPPIPDTAIGRMNSWITWLGDT